MKVLLADDHALIRDTLLAYLEKEEDLEVVTAEDLPAAVVQLARSGPFDVILLDYAMPGMNGLEGLTRMRALTDAPVAIMSGSATRRIADEALAQGAAGFVPKTIGAKALIHAVRYMGAGEVFAPVQMLDTQVPGAPDALAEKLTEREREVLEGLCRGLANKEIARDLGLQEVTVKLHVKNLCRKLDAKNRTQAALLARDAGMF
ncbi:response regulator transcription factor [Acidimangrovimonas sediminis]|uniref:response regulator transcription factor n=1 Tax=Acidimangrovimonas sediminis TaxID=2056283 RepID=UPI000C7FF5F0|nr:response regulator transcription factor [Acidimangrovimonas sediminis]